MFAYREFFYNLSVDFKLSVYLTKVDGTQVSYLVGVSGGSLVSMALQTRGAFMSEH
jgi:hypothetical protein